MSFTLGEAFLRVVAPMPLQAWQAVCACFATYPYLAPFTIVGFLSLATYVGLLLAQWFVCDMLLSDNLKKRYDAQWALVTGGSSGIGRAIVEKLVRQGVNVVIVALQDKLLDDFYTQLCREHPHLQFRKVGVSLSDRDESTYMKPIIAATSDIHISLLFNNAGFICVGFFSDVPLAKWMANYHCNATCALPISHHFLNKMMASGRKGLLAYTSSSACLFPNPFSSLYASTKAFLTMFACSIAAEVRSLGIDVVVVHPSPMATNFFKAGEGLAMLMAFKKLAAGPEVIADVLFSSAGRFVVRDQGAVTIFFRLVLKVLDSVFFAELTSWFAHTTGDYQQFTAQRLKAKAS